MIISDKELRNLKFLANEGALLAKRAGEISAAITVMAVDGDGSGAPLCPTGEREFRMHLGRSIKGVRERRGIAQKRLAYEAGISPAALCNIELGDRGPYALTLYKISLALNVSVDLLLKGDAV